MEARGGQLAGLQRPDLGPGGRLRVLVDLAVDAAAEDHAGVEADDGVGLSRVGQAQLDPLHGAGDEAVGPGQGVAAGQPGLAVVGDDHGRGGAADEHGHASSGGPCDGAGHGLARHRAEQHLGGAAGQREAVRP
ncbi:hypothetical protein GCM10020219_008230 [Nonomuraea dietziae]